MSHQPQNLFNKINTIIQEEVEGDGSWSCAKCTFSNKVGKICSLCDTPRISIEINNNTNNSNYNNDDEKTIEIIVLTWNICGTERLFLKERIDHIGQYIIKNKVNFVAFQEVTTEAFNLIKDSDWFKQDKWSCTTNLEKSQEFDVFNLFLTTFVIDTNNCEAVFFKNSVMHSYLSIINVKIKSNDNNKTLIFATSKLESSVNFDTGELDYADDYGKLRRNQLEVCFHTLSSYEYDNIIFGGDFQWIDPIFRCNNDDVMLLWDGWKDCWGQMKLLDPGYTINGNLNPMIQIYWTLRFDRILYYTKNDKNNIKLNSINIIGMDRVMPKLPVLPSLHFGVLAEFVWE